MTRSGTWKRSVRRTTHGRRGASVGNVAIVTGASRGIGYAVACRLSEDGYAVINISRTRQPKDSPTYEVPANVGSARQVGKAFETVCAEYGAPDVLVHCAGVYLGGDIRDERAAVQMLHTNVEGTWHVMRAFALRGGECMVNIASTSAFRPSPEWPLYAATKAFGAHLALSMGIPRAYNVAPGRTATELRAQMAPDEDPDSIMQPSAVADLVSYLVGDQGGYLNGQTITIRKPDVVSEVASG